MADYAGTILTKAGLHLHNKVEGGVELVYTRAVLGDGRLPEGTQPEDLTQLIHERLVAHSLRVSERSARQSIIEAVFDNREVAEGFAAWEIGLYARDPDVGEILFAVVLAAEHPDWFDPTSEAILQEITHEFIIRVSQSSDVTIEVGEMSNFITRPEFAGHNHDGTSAGGIRITGADVNGPVAVADYATKAGHADTAALAAKATTAGSASAAVPNSALDLALRANAALSDNHAKDYTRHPVYCKLAGSSGAYSAALTPAPSGYVDGMQLLILPHVNSAANATLNLNGFGARALSGSYRANTPYLIVMRANKWEQVTKPIEAIEVAAKPPAGQTWANAQTYLDGLFTFASEGKAAFAGVIGAPSTAAQTFAVIRTHTQNAKTTLAANLTGKGVAATGTETLAVLAAKVSGINGATLGVTLEMRSYITSGVFVVPAKCHQIDIFLVGGGGSGGGSSAGGYGGQVKQHNAIRVVPGQSYAVTVGAGGVSGASPARAGTPSSFGAYVALGGRGGDSTSAGLTEGRKRLWGVSDSWVAGGPGVQFTHEPNPSGQGLSAHVDPEVMAGAGYVWLVSGGIDWIYSNVGARMGFGGGGSAMPSAGAGSGSQPGHLDGGSGRVEVRCYIG